ncbi:helix-turn-helix transcriptional regulator [Nocardioides sp.]|jgi:transcriptional regulator with XRE-family HTH domain|uniref:helix-turn-helix domain-containing protein n=1 Tax=Nocardioides sp. TaxID=35761 RepID=UPI00261320AA|nr:helix-turn-helix transcriptional regulator [Nocardioides sp.]
MTKPSDGPTWDEYGRALGVNLQRARRDVGLSQEWVAHRAGISAYTYQKFEKGESKPGTPMNPQLRTLVALAQVLEVPLFELLPPTFPELTLGQ